MRTVTCHTEGCFNNGIPIELDLVAVDEETGQSSPVDGVTCGMCRQPITDIAPIAA
jgi:hypothetical protein